MGGSQSKDHRWEDMLLTQAEDHHSQMKVREGHWMLLRVGRLADNVVSKDGEQAE